MSPDQCTPSWGLAEDSARQLEITRQMGEASWNNRQQTAEEADQLHRAGCIAMVREAKQALEAEQLVSGNVKQHRTRPSQQQEPHHPSAAPHACGCWISNLPPTLSCS